MDTLEITDVYMQRPSSFASLGLGEWFCSALGIIDKELIYTSTKEAKHIILKRYMGVPDLLNRLNRFNQLFVER